MKLNKDTLTVLKNFSDINANCLFRPGNVLSSVNESKSLLAEADIEDTIDSEFGIYNLKEFLSALSIVKDPEIEVNNKTLKITSETSTGKIKYGCADPSILTCPPKNGVTIPSIDVEFTISTDTLVQVLSAAASLKLGSVKVSNGDTEDTLTIAVESSDGSTRNSFSIALEQDVAVASDVESFVAEFPVDLLNVLRSDCGEYSVKISRKGISEWAGSTNKVKYWVATNTTSRFDAKN